MKYMENSEGNIQSDIELTVKANLKSTSASIID